jgi:hypothetical protein
MSFSKDDSFGDDYVKYKNYSDIVYLDDSNLEGSAAPAGGFPVACLRRTARQNRTVCSATCSV